MRWCAAEFEVRPLVAQSNIVDTRYGTYDVLISISVATHLSPSRLDVLFRTFTRIINPGGVVIFSTHGPAEVPTARGINEYIDPAKVLGDLEHTGSAFIPYPHYTDADLGDTFLTKDYVNSSDGGMRSRVRAGRLRGRELLGRPGLLRLQESARLTSAPRGPGWVMGGVDRGTSQGLSAARFRGARAGRRSRRGSAPKYMRPRLAGGRRGPSREDLRGLPPGARG